MTYTGPDTDSGTDSGRDGRATLTGLLVYESMFGNTEQVARAVADGLRAEGVDLQVVNVRDHASPADTPSAASCDLVVVGAPTHGFSLSRPSTRRDAVRQGAPALAEAAGVREWLDALPRHLDRPVLAAAFDTRVTKVRRMPKAAATRASHLLERHGCRVLVRPSGFLVTDISGPLVDGELERAVAWGRQVAREATHTLAASAARG